MWFAGIVALPSGLHGFICLVVRFGTICLRPFLYYVSRKADIKMTVYLSGWNSATRVRVTNVVLTLSDIGEIFQDSKTVTWLRHVDNPFSSKLALELTTCPQRVRIRLAQEF